jgi:short-subunit dehydrogenase
LDLWLASVSQWLSDGLRCDRSGVCMLVNNARNGKMGEFAEVSLADTTGQIQWKPFYRLFGG